MLSLLKVVLAPERTQTQICIDTQDNADARVTGTGATICAVSKTQHAQRQVLGLWNPVLGPTNVTYGQKDLWKNLFNWRAFTYKNRSKVLV